MLFIFYKLNNIGNIIKYRKLGYKNAFCIYERIFLILI